jgi:hypothetical protein
MAALRLHQRRQALVILGLLHAEQFFGFAQRLHGATMVTGLVQAFAIGTQSRHFFLISRTERWFGQQFGVNRLHFTGAAVGQGCSRKRQCASEQQHIFHGIYLKYSQNMLALYCGHVSPQKPEQTLYPQTPDEYFISNVVQMDPC